MRCLTGPAATPWRSRTPVDDWSASSKEGDNRVADERGLTSGETRLCKTIFRDTIPTGAVRIIKRKVGFGGFTPFGNINASEDSYEADYIGTHLFGRPPNAHWQWAANAHWLVHELAHVWQYHVGMPKAPMFFKSRRVARSLLWKRTGTLDLDTYHGDAALYAYRIDRKGLDLLDFNLEHQAEIIADYFAWTLWDLRPDFKWNDWPVPTVEQLLGVLSKFNQDPSYPRRATASNARRADRRS